MQRANVRHQGMNLILAKRTLKLNHFLALAQNPVDAGSGPPIAVGTQMRALLHL
jgi:hypothetical protein